MTLAPALVAQLDAMAAKLDEMAREAGIPTVATLSHDRHAAKTPSEAYALARTYAVSIGKLTEARELGYYRAIERKWATTAQ